MLSVIVLSVVVVLAAPAAMAQVELPPGIGIRLAEVPAEMADDPRAQNYVIDHVDAGTTIERRIQIANGDPVDFDVEMFAVGATVEDGVFRPEAEREQNDLASWISVDPTSLSLPSQETADLTLRIDVPEDAEEGEQFAVVYAERQPDDVESGIGFAQRTGVRVYLSVGDGVAPVPDFEITAFTATRSDAGEPGLRATILNTGGRALDLEGDVRLDDGPGGIAAGPFDVEIGTTLLPGASEEVELLLDPDLPDGPWLATLDVRSGLLERQAVATITFPEAGGPPTIIEVEDPSSGGLGIIAGALGVTGLPLWLLWRRRKTDDEDEELADEVGAEDSAAPIETTPVQPDAPPVARSAIARSATPRRP